MKRATITLLITLIGFVLTSCAEKATPEDLQAMCAHMIDLKGDIETLNEKELTAKIDEDYAEQEETLKSRKAGDMKAWDERLKAALAEEGADQEAVTKEFQENKKVTEVKYNERLGALGPKKENAIADAKQKAKDSKAEFDAAVKECKEKEMVEGTSKPKKECRMKATNLDEYWNLCQ